MKILFFVESLRSGGKERRLVELIKGIQECTDYICELVLTRRKIHYHDILDTNVKIHFLVRKIIKKDPRLFFKFYKICKNFNPDVIHVWGNMVAIYSLPTKVLLKIPMINNQITDAPRRSKYGILGPKITFPFSDRIISNSKAGLEVYHAPRERSRVIYNGFDFDRIESIKKPSEVKKTFDIDSKFVIGMVASFTEKKDYDTYLDAANIVLKRRKDIKFLCIGSGDHSAYKMKVAKANKDSVLFLGRQDDVESIMSICDIGILTTNLSKHGEGISNALLEFMALSKPVIATNGGGTPELVIDGKTGFLIPPKSPKVLAEKIKVLISDRKVRHSMGMRGRQRVQDHFNIDKMVENFIAVYKEFI